ncbi:MAG: arabinan endo-1,5-alpha-L-arabinosidase [Lewinellaceae bacterium]|nr:arabinan endo-1,5-alpha-L-arabinosidase [Lewinellaceae bacterium]
MQMKPAVAAIFFLPLLFSAASLYGQAADSMRVHDPVAIRQDDTYYLFCTGPGISVWSSGNLKEWKREKPVFEAAPTWAPKAVPGFKNHIWAPDISSHNGLYYLYYSVSAFGKNTSAIGVATNRTLHPESPDFKWTDHGIVVQSVPNRDLWNAIDPNLAFDEQGAPWLAFGSFWEGLKLVKLDSSLLAIAQPEQWFTIARRQRAPFLADADPGDGALEAPFIFRKNGYFYLFASYDYCCRGAKSDYKVRVGRSEQITGPYLDREGGRMDEGGGTLVLAGNARWPGLGHNSIYTFGGKDYFIFHAYDMADNGRPKLKVSEVEWDSGGWPVVKQDNLE